MAGVLPTVRGGSSALLPLARSITLNNEVVPMENGAEVRYLDRCPLDTFVLSYKAIPQSDRFALDQFIATQRGSYDTTWVFPFKPAARVQNGNFALGMNGWTTTAAAGFTPFISQGAYRRGSETDAVYINSAVTIPAHSGIAANYRGSTFAYPAGKILTLDLWAQLITNSSFPAGVTATLQPGIFVTNGSGTLGTVATPTSLVGTHGWTQITGNLTNGFVSATTGAPLVLCTLANTTASAITLPFNCVAFVFSEVRVFDPAPETGVFLGCTFEDDAFTWTLNEEWRNSVDGKIRCRQTRLGGQGPVNVLGAFPSFGPSPGFKSGYPYVTTDSYYVAKNDFSTGPKKTYTFTGTSGMPSRALRNWTLTFSTLTDADLGALESHFLEAAGNWQSFAFTDPVSGKLYTSVRYDMDALEINHIHKGLSSATVRLVEAYNTTTWTA